MIVIDKRVNRLYLDRGQLRASKVWGMWIDAGTHESLLEASILAHEAFDPERIRIRRAQTSLSKHEATDIIPKIIVGLVIHNSEKYIHPCLESLLAQNHDNLEVVVFDNASTDDSVQIIRNDFPKIRIIESEENIGFARSHNEILRETVSDFYACINIDMILEPNFLTELLRTIDEKPICGSSGGKLKRWDFLAFSDNARSQGKTNFIDSVGIRIKKSHRFEDIGQGEVDYGQFDDVKAIFGVSGAAALYTKAYRKIQDRFLRGEKISRGDKHCQSSRRR